MLVVLLVGMVYPSLLETLQMLLLFHLQFLMVPLNNQFMEFLDSLPPLLQSCR
jgi:hypothetical protein